MLLLPIYRWEERQETSMIGFDGVGINEKQALDIYIDCDYNWITIMSPSTKGQCEELLNIPTSESLVSLDNVQKHFQEKLSH